jgi:putative membrane protein
MSALLRVCTGAVAAGLCCLPLGVLIAQQATDSPPRDIQPGQVQPDAANPLRPGDQIRPRTGQPYTSNYRGETAKGGGQMAVEAFFANCLLKNNKAEIELAKFASEQSQNPQVKQFAEMLAKDHQKVVDRLQQVAASNPNRAGTPAVDPNSPAGTTRGVTESPGLPGSPATTTTAGGGPLMQVAAIEEKIKERCQQALREELQSKSGAEFDECYIGSQIAGHMQSLAALEVLSQESQGRLKEIAEAARPTVQQHLDQAKQIAKQLKSGSGSAQAQRPTTTDGQRQ